ncbi:MAG TPA: hypothetical protein ACN46V_08970 [Prochlorococcus sp.]
MPIASTHEWETEALMAGRSCLECIEKIENGDLIIQRSIGTSNTLVGE